LLDGRENQNSAQELTIVVGTAVEEEDFLEDLNSVEFALESSPGKGKFLA